MRRSTPTSVGAYFYPRPPRGGRRYSGLSCFVILDFYPRPPRGGRRPAQIPPPADRQFLSTPSARRATTLFLLKSNQNQNFYPRPPRGGRQSSVLHFAGRRAISIHALREEGDAPFPRPLDRQRISIHALREEGDGCD